MKEIIENWETYLIAESSLNRVYKHITEHDCCLISGWRYDPEDRSKCVGPSFEGEISVDEGVTGSKKANRQRNSKMKAYLLEQGYWVTEVVGSYIEDFKKTTAKEVKEGTLFVVNHIDDSVFFEKMESLGRLFCQDSVMMIPKGGKESYLIGTNNAEWPGLGVKVLKGHFVGGRKAEFMTRVHNRPFTFPDVDESKEPVFEAKSKLGINARWVVSTWAKEVDKKLTPIRKAIRHEE